MKKILATTIALTSLSAFADWSLKNESALNDLMYQPQAKTIWGQTELEFSTYKADIDFSGSNYTKAKSDITKVSQNVGYSFTDKISAHIKISQLLNQKTTLTYGPASTSPNTVESYKNSGFEDPTIGGKIRLLSQSDSLFNGDFTLDVSPSLGNKKESSSSPSIKGNAYRGGTLFSGNFEIGKKYTDMSWKVGALLDMFGKQKSQSATNTNEISETDSYTNVNVDFSWQWVVSSTFTVNLNTAVGFEAEETSTNQVGDSKTVVDSNNTFLIGTDLIFYASPKMSFNVNINGKSHGDADMKVTTISSGSTVILNGKNYTEGLFGIGAKYEF